MDTIRTTIPPTEQGKGYLKALEGLLLTAKSNDDKYLFLSKVEKTEKNLRAMTRDFAGQTENRLHTDYDVGYFQALESYTRKLEETNPAHAEKIEKK